MSIITVANAKGGVGKTTVATNLSAALATYKKRNYKICAVDFDFQSNLTQSLIKEDTEITYCMYDILGGHEPDIKNCIYPTVHEGLDLIPSVVQLSGLEIGLYKNFPESNLMFRDFARSYLLRNYDFVVCDVGPSLNIFLNQALATSDGVFIIAEVGSFNSLVNIEATVEHTIGVQKLNSDLKHMKLIMNKLNRSRNVDKQNIEEIQHRFAKEDLFKTVIPVSADFRNVEAEQHMTIFKYKTTSKGATSFRWLAREVINEFIN